MSSVASNYHIEISCSDAGIYDRFVVQEVIKEIASSNSLHGQVEGAKGFKVVLLMEVDRLTTQAQAALRRTMEKYTSSCRLILYATNPTKVMEPLRSRCLCLRVPAPTHDQVRCPETLEVICMRSNGGALLPLAMMHAIIHAMMHDAASEASLLRPPLPSLSLPPSLPLSLSRSSTRLCLPFSLRIATPWASPGPGFRIPDAQVCDVLQKVAHKENLNLPPVLASKVAQASGRNLRRALLMLEATKVQQYPFQENQAVQLPDWEVYITQLAKEISQDQSPQKLLRAREMLYELLTNCIPANIILKTLTRELFKSLDDDLKHEVALWAAFYEHRILQGSKEIFHLEAFVAKFMSIYKKWLINMFA